MIESPTAQSILATVPSSGAATGISIFIASIVTTASPAFTAVPTGASILTTLPCVPALTLIEPAPAAAAFFAGAFGAATAAAGAGAAF